MFHSSSLFIQYLSENKHFIEDYMRLIIIKESYYTINICDEYKEMWLESLCYIYHWIKFVRIV